jgi:hypothetical protein
VLYASGNAVFTKASGCTAVMLKVNELVVPPPGEGVVTATDFDAIAATSEVLIAAVRRVLLT